MQRKNPILNGLFLAFLGVSLCFFQSCGCPESEKIGSIDLTTEARAWVPYQGNEVLQFQNQDGESLVLRSAKGREVSRDPLCIRTTCTEAKYDGKSSCEFYSAQSERFVFSSEDQNTVLDLLLYSSLYQPETTRFVDVLRITLSKGTPIGSAEKLVQIRFTETFDPSTLSLLPKLQSMGTVVLNGIPFPDVQGEESQPVQFYYNHTRGLVGFRVDGDTWHLLD